MLLAIPNPKKNLTIDFPLERVKIGVERLSHISNKYKFTKSNPVFNQYTFEATEFLSLGVYIDINLSNVSESKTEIIIEIRRQVGTFNQSHEVTKANQHLQSIIDLISQGIAMSDSDFSEIQRKVNEKKNKGLIEVNGKMVSKNYKRNRIIITLIFGFIIFCIAWLVSGVKSSLF